jgi:DNA-binding beta-propeller fold protein YncE
MRVQVFSPEGRFIRGWKGDPSDAFGDPTGIAFIGDQVFIADYKKSAISVFDASGRPIRTIGKEGSGPGEFAGISMIVTDADGHIFATDYNNGRIQEFDAAGTFVATILLPNGARFRLPWGLAVTNDGDLIVAEFEAGRVVRIRS